MKQLRIIALFWLLLSACSAAETKVVSIQAPQSFVTKTFAPTKEAAPSEVPFTTPVLTPAFTPTKPVVATETPTPREIIQVTLTPTLTEIPNQIKLPEWIVEPLANILLLGVAETDSIYLYNVDNHEQYAASIEINDFDPRWQWQEQDGLYLLNPRGIVIHQKVLNVLTGEFIKPPETNKDVMSPDGRYSVQMIKKEDSPELFSIVDNELGTVTKLHNPYHEYVTRNEDFVEYADAYWSPDGKLIAVWYKKHYYSDNMDDHLVIYTPVGEIFRQQSNLDTMWGNPWNSNLPYRILYIDGHRFVPPCIFEVTENNRFCLEFLREWAINQGVVLLNYDWSPDGGKISFVYYNSEKPETGLCYYDLITEDIVCPIMTNDLKLNKQMYARKAYWSPDSKYMALIFDDIGIADVIGYANIAIVDVENQSFQILEGDYIWPFSNPWRPPLPESIGE